MTVAIPRVPVRVVSMPSAVHEMKEPAVPMTGSCLTRILYAPRMPMTTKTSLIAGKRITHAPTNIACTTMGSMEARLKKRSVAAIASRTNVMLPYSRSFFCSGTQQT